MAGVESKQTCKPRKAKAKRKNKGKGKAKVRVLPFCSGDKQKASN
jgi:hypothetical protein